MIAIKGMKMPNGCSYCRFKRTALTGKNNHYEYSAMCHAKSVKGRKLPRAYNLLDFRPNWCPLVEVNGEEGEDDG